MRVLQVNGYQSPGRRFNGLSLKPHLEALGVSSKHFVWEQDRQEEGVVSLHGTLLRKVNRLTRGVEKVLSLQSQLYSNGMHMRRMEAFREADLVHYHIIHSGFLSMQSLPAMTAEKPSLWTLHDPWAMTGHCIHPFSCQRWKTGCGQCPDLKTDFAIQRDTTALNFRLKRMAYRRSNFEILVASSWMENMVRQSPLMDGVPVHKVPFGLDLDFFKPGDQAAAKARLGIEPHRLVLCFRSVVNDFKGLQYVIEALDRLQTQVPICLLTLNDKGRIEKFKDRFQVVELGWTNDDSVMQDVYSATDLFLMPSLADSFGLMAVEAMACGKPTICFEGTALPEVVFTPEAGLAVPSRDSAALAAAMERLIGDPQERLARGARSRQLAEQHYDIRLQAERMVDVYERVVQGRQSGK
ncbi:glycosyltransferase family 4 protein [Achromobacter mucicolens]|uniref:D-inositol-3-phosphate glycosyltransferase n=2 Tax=Achromobacter mucicolens TaxID=1389922 RepID=A0ABM8L6H7_9BURK|nr:glycosyltransferase family 4 protein [Achromobacter mucicolens]MCP2514194.1 glycosyltransferase family 4 protein [Achromobacter mucicolens]CAB3816097.1 D-inositol-3-phosphate glycosyltransferase [Achromobacter mucicolens]